MLPDSYSILAIFILTSIGISFAEGEWGLSSFCFFFLFVLCATIPSMLEWIEMYGVMHLMRLLLIDYVDSVGHGLS